MRTHDERDETLWTKTLFGTFIDFDENMASQRGRRSNCRDSQLAIPHPFVQSSPGWSKGEYGMATVGSECEAKTHLPRLLERVERGETITITRARQARGPAARSGGSRRG